MATISQTVTARSSLKLDVQEQAVTDGASLPIATMRHRLAYQFDHTAPDRSWSHEGTVVAGAPVTFDLATLVSKLTGDSAAMATVTHCTVQNLSTTTGQSIAVSGYTDGNAGPSGVFVDIDPMDGKSAAGDLTLTASAGTISFRVVLAGLA